jgi:hypothetical protein
MQGNERNFLKHAGKRLKAARILICSVCVILCLSYNACTNYNPSFYPSYDVLNPGAEVRANPLRITDDGYFVVNQAFLMWVEDLKLEIQRLRKELE